MQGVFRAVAFLAGIVLLAVIVLSSRPVTPAAAPLEPPAPPEPQGVSSPPAIVSDAVGEIVESAFRLTYGGEPLLIIHPGASYIQPFLTEIDLAPGDALLISAPDGTQATLYDSSDAGRWAFPVDGDTVVIRLSTPNPAATGFSGVLISRYSRGFTAGETAQSICGGNDLRDAVCYQNSHPAEYGLRQPVARLQYSDGTNVFVCTAWRVGPGNFMLTNQHCIDSQERLNTAEVWFNYQRASCNGAIDTTAVKPRPGTLLYTSQTYDVALFTLHPDDFALVEGFGYLELDNRAPTPNEAIFIPQHPLLFGSTGQKKLGIVSSFSSDGDLCRVNAAQLDGYAVGTDLGYFCDTSGSSSGSPVIAANTLKVIGVHHLGVPNLTACGGTPTWYNQAVRMDRIAPLIAPFLGPQVTLTPSITPTFTHSPTHTWTFTPSPTPTYTPTPTPSHTPTATPPRISVDLLQDGGFEAQSPAWKITNTTGDDKVKPKKQRSGLFAFHFKGSDSEKSKLVQKIALDEVVFQTGDTLELTAHIDIKGTVDGFMMLKLKHADGTKVKPEPIYFPAADHYEPRTIEIPVTATDVVKMTAVFKNRSLTGAKVMVDDVSLLLSTPIEVRGVPPSP